jgi:formylglycine-generating enzyme required for sulfatase activity
MTTTLRPILAIALVTLLASCDGASSGSGQTGPSSASPSSTPLPTVGATASGSGSPIAAASASAAPPATPPEMVYVAPAAGVRVALHQPDRSYVLDVAALFIDKDLVTVADWARCVAAGACKKPYDATLHQPGHERWPATGIDYALANDYCRWMGKRLPSTGEWQLAAAGPENRTYPWGNDDPPADKDFMCWRRDAPCDVGTHPRSDTPTGIHDMAGNAFQVTHNTQDDLPQYLGSGYNACVASGADCRKGIGAVRTYVMNLHTPLHVWGFRCAKSAS